MGDTGIILNITDSSARAPYRHAGTWQQSKGVKRKFSNVSKEPEAKRQPAPPSQKYQSKNANKLAEKNKGKNSPSKKTTSVASEENQKGRPAVKTSSLFKNNPEVPAIERTKITQLQEQVFSSDSFSELELHPHLVSTITNVLNMTHMTSVQKRTIPVLMSGRDALVRSQTGSGKTLAYGIPLVQALQGVTPKIQRIDGPYALIIVPTRELALQSFTTIQKLLKPFTWIVPGVLMGGEKRKSEKARLRKGINILISTPGRLVDHIKSTQSIHFTRVRWLIVDEADRILDLGFEKDVTAILNALNAQCQERQNVLLSATLSQGVTRLADVSLHNPLSITITDDSQTEAQRAVTDLLEPSQQSDGETSSFAMPEKLRQHAVVVPSKLKLVTLAAFILAKWKCEKKTKMIIFFPSCELVEFHHKLLSSILELIDKEMQTHSKAFFRLHGNMEQEERTEVFQQFTQARAGVLFCTDVAARGLDLPQVTWIVQYNAPASAAEYIHRVGRTARLGAQGSSLLILLPSEAEYIRILADHKISVSEIKMDEVLSNLLKMDFLEIKRVGIKKSQASDPQAVRERATVLQTKFEDYVHRSPDTALCAKREPLDAVLQTLDYNAFRAIWNVLAFLASCSSPCISSGVTDQEPVALQSYVRSYATYPKTLKHIFHVRSLHLGHVAKSFGLRDAPHNLSQQLAGNPKHLGKAGPRRANVHKKIKAKQKFSDLLLSEFSSGFSPKPKKAKHDTNQKIET